MGLQEKRRVKMLQEEVLPALKQEIKDLCGADIPWEIDWESLLPRMEALDNIEHQGLRRITDAFRSICIDDLGRSAVKERVKQIVVKNHEKPEEKKLSFSSGILEVHGAWAAGWDGYHTVSEIQQILENGL